MAQRIYFDESGFTGNNLLDIKQNYFAYASVVTDDFEAKEFVEMLFKKFKLQGDELKGKYLVQHNRGRSAIDEIFKHFEGRIKVSISDKKYALACKFFEYIFEPCISKQSSIFYGLGFHLFISNILYLELIGKRAGAEEVFAEFEHIMRKKDASNLDSIFSSSVHPENSPIITLIREFTQVRSKDIAKELFSLETNSIGQWALDLTGMALESLLSSWGKIFEKITVVCDTSKPLQENQVFFEKMIGNTAKVQFEVYGGEPQPMTVNLSGPIEFLNSKETHGIQLADALAGATAYIFQDQENLYAKKWGSYLPAITEYGNILPDFDEINLGDHKGQLNVMLLIELHKRAMEKCSLTDGIGEFIQSTSTLLKARPIQTN